jgi:hypothetical protein
MTVWVSPTRSASTRCKPPPCWHPAQGDYPQARSYLEELLAIGRQTGDHARHRIRNRAVGYAGAAAGAAGNLKEDKEWLLSIYREFHDEREKRESC